MKKNPHSNAPSASLRSGTGRVRLAAVSVAAASALLLAACGSDSSASSDSVADPVAETTPVEAPVDTTPVETTPAESTPAETTPAAETTVPAAAETVAPAATETTVAAAAADPAAASDGSVDGEWKITTGSEAGYRVPEILQGQEVEGVGRTSAVTGSMTIAGTQATAGTFEFDLTQLKSDSDRRDSQVQGRILETAEFPKATFTLTAPVDFGKVPADKEEVTAKAEGTLELHGVSKPVSIDLSARRNGGNVEVLGSLEIAFADYGIEDPSFAPFVEVGKTGFIEWLLVMAK